MDSVKNQAWLKKKFCTGGWGRWMSEISELKSEQTCCDVQDSKQKWPTTSLGFSSSEVCLQFLPWPPSCLKSSTGGVRLFFLFFLMYVSYLPPPGAHLKVLASPLRHSQRFRPHSVTVNRLRCASEALESLWSVLYSRSYQAEATWTGRWRYGNLSTRPFKVWVTRNAEVYKNRGRWRSGDGSDIRPCLRLRADGRTRQ